MKIIFRSPKPAGPSQLDATASLLNRLGFVVERSHEGKNMVLNAHRLVSFRRSRSRSEGNLQVVVFHFSAEGLFTRGGVSLHNEQAPSIFDNLAAALLYLA